MPVVHYPLVCRAQTPPERIRRSYPAGQRIKGDASLEPPHSVPATVRTAAERFAAVDDLVMTFFEVAAAEKPGQENRAMLQNMALVNTTFFPLASSALWRSLIGVGLTPLIRILNRFRIKTQNTRSPTDLSRAIEASREWKAFLYYASIVEELDIHTVDVGVSLIPLLSSIAPDNTPLFPALKRLRWNAAADPNDHLLYILAPSIRRLQIIVPEFYGDAETEDAFQGWSERFRAKLDVLCPDIQELGIFTSELYPSGIYLANYFLSLHNIEVSVLEGDGRDHAVGEDVGVLAPAVHVRKLDLGPFSGLSSVALCMTVSTQFFSGFLRDVHLSCRSFKWYPGNLYMSDHINPILRLHLLERVVLDLPNHVFKFNKHELLLLGENWPKLVDLRLSFRLFEDYAPPDIRCLGRLSRLCPELTNLEIPAVSITHATNNLVINASPHSLLSSFAVGDYLGPAHIKEEEIIRALAEAFPHLTPAAIRRSPRRLRSIRI